MKAFAAALVLTLSGGLAVAHEHHGTKAKTSMTSSKGTMSRLEGEVVSTDPSASSLVLKTGSGDQTLTVTGKAITRLKTLQPGEKVLVRSRNDEVISIQPVKVKHSRHASHVAHTMARASRSY